MSNLSPSDPLAQDFVEFSVKAGVLRFGDFKTKAGRQSPYFFNTGLFDDGEKLMRLGEFYARRLLASGLEFDMLFGPAYKGITLAAAVAIGLAREGRSVPYAYNRKEAKDHGEGGTLVGAPVKGRVLIIDDVITDGASKREAADLIRAAGATPVGVAITMDRQERAKDDPADRRSGEIWSTIPPPWPAGYSAAMVSRSRAVSCACMTAIRRRPTHSATGGVTALPTAW